MPFGLGFFAAAGAGGAAGSYQLIQTITSNGSSFSLSFTNIPQTFTHLQIRYVAKSTNASTGNIAFEIAPYTAGSFSRHSFTANGVSFSNSTVTSQDFIQVNDAIPLSGTTDAFGAGVVDILDYTNTSIGKTLRIFQGQTVSNVRVGLHAGRSGSTNAVTEIGMTLTAGEFANGSRVSLYGIRG